MKKYVFIIIFISFTIFGTEFSQVLRVPLLISHFIEHSAKDNSSFTEFLVNHYLIKHENNGDKAKDDSLPFKTSTSSQSLNLISNLVKIDNHYIDITEPNYYILPRDENFKQSLLSNSIWNPPKKS